MATRSVKKSADKATPAPTPTPTPVKNAKEILAELQTKGRFQVQIPTNEITTEGAREIRETMFKMGFPPLPEDWSWDSIVQKGPYTGTFPKRVSNWLYKEHRIQIPSLYMSVIGNIVAKHVEDGQDAVIEHTVDFRTGIDWYSGHFGDDGSCYWGSHELSRRMLQNNGAYAMRLWQKSAIDNLELHYFRESWTSCARRNHCSYCKEQLEATEAITPKFAMKAERKKVEIYQGWGRVWVVPDCPNDGSLAIFNSYPRNDLRLIRAARILASITGLSYQSVTLYCESSTDSPMYINNGSGYIIGPTHAVAELSRVDMQNQLRRPPYALCAKCGTGLRTERDAFQHLITGAYLCRDCFLAEKIACSLCHEEALMNNAYDKGGANGVIYSDDNGDFHELDFVCGNCIDERLPRCPICGTRHTAGDPNDREAQACYRCRTNKQIRVRYGAFFTPSSTTEDIDYYTYANASRAYHGYLQGRLNRTNNNEEANNG